MEGAGDDCSKEDILSSRDQSQEVRANRRNVAHADDAGDPWNVQFWPVQGSGIAKTSWGGKEEAWKGGSPGDKTDWGRR